ncbi:hypothetical protein CISG_08758 [Coccidioides immitis RMSCC 3703]|uniref:Uncharacterized protein n=1 Tax=Coccidioides immitis RMSCC 3703 TaxID=454286 RepID=A0A0J8R6P5_COCIT|nr:hypothetical protein CISG_08758 [Coccidioides immitis RMSCC 3703]
MMVQTASPGDFHATSESVYYPQGLGHTAKPSYLIVHIGIGELYPVIVISTGRGRPADQPGRHRSGAGRRTPKKRKSHTQKSVLVAAPETFLRHSHRTLPDFAI